MRKWFYARRRIIDAARPRASGIGLSQGHNEQGKQQAVTPFGTGSFCGKASQMELSLPERTFLPLSAMCSLQSPGFCI